MLRPRHWIPALFIGVVGVSVAVLFAPRVAKTSEVGTATISSAPAPIPPSTFDSKWCGNGVEALPSDVCYIDGRGSGERSTLVIWLHGVIGKNTNWSHDHEKMLTRMSKSTNIELLFPKGILGAQVYAWPGTAEDQAKDEEGLIEQWMTAKTILEQRENKRYGDVFIFGFSSGAYYASSLAMRGGVDVDGYAVLCGGQPMPPSPSPTAHFAPSSSASVLTTRRPPRIRARTPVRSRPLASRGCWTKKTSRTTSRKRTSRAPSRSFARSTKAKRRALERTR